MCGLVGYVTYNNREKLDIKKMLSTIKHRGPDAQDYKTFSLSQTNVVLGHVRLSIQDLSHGANQPMSDLSHKYHIVFNGEVYNFKEIKKELGEEFTYNTTSDTEVILYAYIKWGVKCVDKFIGMFSIVILDTTLQKLVFINDRLGVKPLYIYNKNDVLIFASELKAILEYSKFEKKIDIEALTQFFQYGYIQPPLSIFEDIKKIEPATIMIYDLDNRKFEVNKYWDIEKIITKSTNYDLEEVEKILKSACEYRMVSDVPVSSFLSSGIDSSLVTALLSKNYKLNTITIGVNDERYNEAKLAKEISTSLNTNHHEKYISEGDLLELVNTLPYFYDEPFSDTSIYPTYLVSKITSEQYKVALSSDGGDESFGGYYRYKYFKKYYNFLSNIPKSIRFLLSKTLNIFEKIGLFRLINIPMMSLKIQKIQNSLEANNISEFYENLNTYIPKKTIKSLLKEFKFNRGYFEEFDSINSKYNDDILNSAMAIDYKTYLYQILMKVDRASMANSIEVREPLLDHRIIELALNIDSKYKLDNNESKIPLKKVLSKFIDLNLLTKNKKGFSIPIEEWLRKDLKNIVDKYTNESAIKSSNILNNDEVQKIKSDFYSQKDNYIKLWHIFIFQLWYDTWVKKIV